MLNWSEARDREWVCSKKRDEDSRFQPRNVGRMYSPTATLSFSISER